MFSRLNVLTLCYVNAIIRQWPEDFCFPSASRGSRRAAYGIVYTSAYSHMGMDHCSEQVLSEDPARWESSWTALPASVGTQSPVGWLSPHPWFDSPCQSGNPSSSRACSRL